MKEFTEILKKAKLRMLKMHFDSNTGHLGGNLSCIDAMMVLYHHVLNDEDDFILSKGHSAGALYATLWSKGLISETDLKTFSQDGSVLPAHPSGDSIPGLLFSTGSLGHGPSLCAGLSLAKKLRNEDGRIFCLSSDGEWQEGSCWEALIFSVHHRLDNFILMIDQNGLQGFGSTEEIVSYSDISSRLSSFGAHVQNINGHCFKSIKDSLQNVKRNKFNVIILETIKGNGLHNAGLMESHYLPLTKEQYTIACNFLEKDCK